VPAAVNLVDLYRQTGRDAAAEPVLNKALSRSPNDPALLEAQGLLMVREGKRAEALAPLGEAARRAPQSARYGYVYAVALNDSSQKTAAIEALEAVLKSHPNDREALAALAIFYRDIGNRTMALDTASRLEELEPDNPEVKQLLTNLRSAVQ
jgi:Flp pilus assembly protein TadD